MGKEARIGLAVIGGLLVIFGVVVALRMRQEGGDQLATNPDKTAAEQQASQNAGTPTNKAAGGATAPAKADATAQKPAVDPKAAASGGAGAKTTVVPAADVSKQMPNAAASQWSVVSTKSDSRLPGDLSKAPSYMPNPKSAKPYEQQYGADARLQQPRPWEQAGPASGDNVPRSNPFRRGQAGQSYQGASQVAVLSPPGQPDDPRSGYAATGANAYQSPQSQYASPPPTYAAPQASYAASPHVGQYSIPNARSAPQYQPGDASYGASQVPQGTLRGLDARGTYTVQPNDNYWEISRKVYGAGSYFKALAEHNRRKVPSEDELAVGDVISVPEIAKLEESYPGLCPRSSRREIVQRRAAVAGAPVRNVGYVGGRRYVVQEGDTLFDIARCELGKAARWVEIYELNRDMLGEDFDYLTPGLELALPGEDKADNVTQRVPAPALDYYRR
jgi:nucleoid-associated protein YgaU